MKNRSYDREELVEPSEVPVPSGSGSFVGGRTAERAESELEAELRSQIHDLRNWLAVALAHLDLAASDPDPHQRLDRIRTALTAAQERSERRSLAGTTCEVREVARVSLEHLRARLGPQVRVLSEEGDAPELGVAVPSATLANLLLNLLENAVRATRESGRIGIRSRVVGNRVQVEVFDDGVGMSADMRDRCFEAGVSTKSEPGHGRGLAQVAGTVRDFDGECRVESVEGQGSRFQLLLPAAELPQENRAPAGAVSVSPGEPRRKVLLVEDDPAVGEALSELLAALGGEVTLRASARETIEDPEAVRAQDLILIDQGLPDLPGLDLAARLRRDHSGLTIVLLTGDPRAASHASRSPHVDRVATKPLGLEALRALLQSPISGPPSQQEEADG